MKNVHLFFLSSLLFFSFGATAQISINQEHLPEIGDIVIIATSDTLDVPVGAPGINQEWDYTLLDTLSYDTLNYIAPMDAPNSEDFPTANIVGVQDGAYIFLNSTSTEFWRLGLVGEVEEGSGEFVSIPFSPPSKQFVFPGTYETTFLDSTVIDFMIPTQFGDVRVKNIVLTENTIDGYGTVSTAEGTFNALRMNSYSTSIDSAWIFVFGNWTLVDSTQSMSTTITFLTRESKGPLVILGVEEDGHVSSASHVIGISPQVWQPIAAFSLVNEGEGLIDLTDESQDSPTEWFWDFGDGNTSIEQSPQHTYTQNGMYTVCLTATNSAGSNTVCQTTTILLTPVAAYTFTDQGSGLLDFEDLSTNDPTEWLWDFGDGITSNDQNPSHTYTLNDTYTTCLTATNAAGTHTECQMITVVVVGVNDLATPIALQVFPNPVKDFVHFKINEEVSSPLQISITDAQGRLIYTEQLQQSEQKINTSNWAKGIYLFRVYTSDESASTSGRIVVQ